MIKTDLGHHTQAEALHTPMSLLKVSSSKFGWSISLSTVNLCSLSGSVSLMAVFPTYTVRSLTSVLLLQNPNKEKPKQKMCHSCEHEHHIAHTHTRESQGHQCMTQRRKSERECCVSPCDETVRGGGDPAGRDEGSAAEEALTPQEDSGEPRVRLYGCEGAAHDFVRPPLGCLATCQLCEDTQKRTVRES